MHSLKYRADIDGLRAVAVLSVVVYHLNEHWLSGGFVGVDIFFVISGFLITKIITSQAEEGVFSFAHFYARRIRRIFPALFVMLFASAFMAWLVLPSEEYRTFFQDFKYAAAQLANFRFARTIEYMGAGVETSALLHTWSLGIEEQFYLVWPLVIVLILWVFDRRALKWIMLAGGVISLALCQYYLAVQETNQAFYMFYSRAYELILGALAALNFIPTTNNRYVLHSTSLTGMAMIAGSVLFFTNDTPFPGLMGLIPSIGAALVIYAGNSKQLPGICNRWIAVKPAVFIGLLSYSLYLWHWPLIIFTQSMTGEVLTTIQALAILFLSIVLAFFSYRFVELPFRKANAKDVTTIAKGLVVVLLVIVFGQQMKVQPEKLGRTYHNEKLDIARRNASPSTNICSGGDEVADDVDAEAFVECVFEKHDKMPNVILIGDSHAMSLQHALRKRAEENGLTFQDFGISGCPMFFTNYSVSPAQSQEKRDVCSRISQSLYNKIKTSEHPPQYLIIANRNDLSLIGEIKIQAALATEEPFSFQGRLYEETIEQFKAAAPNAKIILLGQPAVLKQSPFECLDRRHLIPLYKWLPQSTPCSVLLETAEHQAELDEFNASLDRLSLDYKNVKYVAIRDYITQLYNPDGALLYHDHNHLSPFGAEIVADVLLP